MGNTRRRYSELFRRWERCPRTITKTIIQMKTKNNTKKRTKKTVAEL